MNVKERCAQTTSKQVFTKSPVGLGLTQNDQLYFDQDHVYLIKCPNKAVP